MGNVLSLNAAIMRRLPQASLRRDNDLPLYTPLPELYRGDAEDAARPRPLGKICQKI